jgi:hypothetical protein
MPVFGYFCWVGAVLLALLFAVDRQPPRPERVAETFHPNIRIVSPAKQSEALVFSGPTIDYGVKPALEIVDLSARATDPISPALAQIRPDELPQARPRPVAKATLQRPRKRYAMRTPPAPSMYQQVDHWSRSPFNVVGDLRVSPESPRH